jgi:hypothetical protein
MPDRVYRALKTVPLRSLNSYSCTHDCAHPSATPGSPPTNKTDCCYRKLLNVASRAKVNKWHVPDGPCGCLSDWRLRAADHHGGADFPFGGIGRVFRAGYLEDGLQLVGHQAVRVAEVSDIFEAAQYLEQKKPAPRDLHALAVDNHRRKDTPRSP